MSNVNLYAHARTLPRGIFGPLLESPRPRHDEHWTLVDRVPVAWLERFPSRVLKHLRRNLTGEERVASLLSMREMPPIEIAVAPDGRARLIDGHHRLVVARRRGDATIAVQFLVVTKSDERFLP